ncbi:hypothetical protein ACOME3_001233 [Neoechinorhynchus agilis]
MILPSIKYRTARDQMSSEESEEIAKDRSEYNARILQRETSSHFIPKITDYLIFSTITASIGSFFFGWNLSVLNNPIKELRQIYNHSYNAHYGKYTSESMLTILVTLTSALYLIGGILGAVIFAFMAERLGRFGFEWFPIFFEVKLHFI